MPTVAPTPVAIVSLREVNTSQAITIPAGIRKVLGWSKGDQLKLRVTQQGGILVTRETANGAIIRHRDRQGDRS